MKKLGAALMALILAGCSTLQGRPSPVLDMKSLSDTAAGTYAPQTAIQTYYGKDDQEDKRAYRDEVLFLYLAAIDARYRNFVAGITSQRKSGNALLSVVGLYTSALASVSSGNLATGFSASSTFLQGSQGKLNKDLFYEQTMPALINLMDAERAEVRTSILDKLATDRNSDNITYGMSEALMDIGRYEDAASIEKAVATLVQQAAQTLTDAKQKEEAAENDRVALDKANAEQPGGDAQVETDEGDQPAQE